MHYRIGLVVLAFLILLPTGCRTGEYKVDLEIYKKTPALLEADEFVSQNVARNEDGSIMVDFDKGYMLLNVALGLDEGTRKEVVSKALQIFHDEYMAHPDNKKGDGSFRREVIGLKGFVEDTELYVIEWDLDESHPNVVSDRYGYFI